MDDLLKAQAPAATAISVAYNTMPVGTVSTYAGTEAPNGWLLCNGQPIQSATYPALYALIGNKVPDLRSRFVVGTGQGEGLSKYDQFAKGGDENITLSQDQIPSHKHYGFGEFDSKWINGTTGSNNQMGSHGGIDYDNYQYGTTNTGGGQSHPNRPPFFALTYIIKY